ncbi:MAG TPA: heavy-metal-associated domain-containing protein [Balneolaceae bacterium]|nr:heavy-metal-associated domain-containing protein [Balneolaceae bacterium]
MSSKTQATDQTTLSIGDMACSGCAETVQKALAGIKGVQKAEVDLDKESASVVYDAGAVSTEDFKQAVEDAGYEFNGIKN